MKFVSSRDIRNNPAQLRDAVQSGDVVLTAGGKHFAIAVGVGEHDVEETLDLLRRVRALQAMSRVQMHASETLAGQVSDREIDAEITAVRKARRRSA